MKVKECRHCNKELPVDLFPKNINLIDGIHSWCKPCLNKYQKDYKLGLIKKKEPDYSQFSVTEKVCTCCKNELPVELFYINGESLSYFCRICSNIKRKAHYKPAKKKPGRKKKNRGQPYRITNPKEWKAYNKVYMKSYNAEPLAGRRQNIASFLCGLINEGYIIKPEKCNCVECGNSTDKPKAYFPDKFIIYALKTRLKKQEIKDNIQWQCPKCIYARRKKRQKNK